MNPPPADKCRSGERIKVKGKKMGARRTAHGSQRRAGIEGDKKIEDGKLRRWEKADGEKGMGIRGFAISIFMPLRAGINRRPCILGHLSPLST
jgi:hypothetical protein